MGIRYERVTIITCEQCPKHIIDGIRTKRETIKVAKEHGWKIGKVVLCPKCNV